MGRKPTQPYACNQLPTVYVALGHIEPWSLGRKHANKSQKKTYPKHIKIYPKYFQIHSNMFKCIQIYTRKARYIQNTKRRPGAGQAAAARPGPEPRAAAAWHFAYILYILYILYKFAYTWIYLEILQYILVRISIGNLYKDN